MFRSLVSRIFAVRQDCNYFHLNRHALSLTDSTILARHLSITAKKSGPMDKFVIRSPKSKDESPASKPTRNETKPQGGPKIDGDGQQTRRVTRESMAQLEREKYLKMSKVEKRKLYKCGTKFLGLENISTWPEYLVAKREKHCIPVKKHHPAYSVNPELNKKVSVWRGDITTLEIDAIVNAANNSLLGGGGVDGAIHSAAGSKLKQECATLGGCDTGDAKMSCGYNLPAKYVIHTVGPMGEQERLLKNAYKTCLKIVRDNKLRSVAFPCISTGIYGYPNHHAAPVALDTARKFLEEEGMVDMIDRIIFCLFLPVDVKLYEEFLPKYFPVKEDEFNSNDKEAEKLENTEKSFVKKKTATKDKEPEKMESASMEDGSSEQSVDKRSHEKGENSSPNKSPETKKKTHADEKTSRSDDEMMDGDEISEGSEEVREKGENSSPNTCPETNKKTHTDEKLSRSDDGDEISEESKVWEKGENSSPNRSPETSQAMEETDEVIDGDEIREESQEVKVTQV